jgi:hypothetical protein
LLLAIYESNFSHKKNLAEARGFDISQQKTNQSVMLKHHLQFTSLKARWK